MEQLRTQSLPTKSTEQKSWSMAHNVAAYLRDILDACVAIEEVIQGVSLNEYRNQEFIPTHPSGDAKCTA
jgi:hypothetical protein